MLNVDSTLEFLLERALIPVSWIIRGDVTVRSAARRNRNLTVEGPDGVGLFIKQPDDPMNGAGETLRREATFHRLCSEESDLAPLRRFITHLIESEDSETILVFELISDAITLELNLMPRGGHHRRGGEHPRTRGWVPSIESSGPSIESLKPDWRGCRGTCRGYWESISQPPQSSPALARPTPRPCGTSKLRKASRSDSMDWVSDGGPRR